MAIGFVRRRLLEEVPHCSVSPRQSLRCARSGAGPLTKVCLTCSLQTALLRQDVDMEMVNSICDSMEEQEVDGPTLLMLDDQQVRYDLGVGSLKVLSI